MRFGLSLCSISNDAVFFVLGLMRHAIPDRFPSMKRGENVDESRKKELLSMKTRDFVDGTAQAQKIVFWGPVLRDAPRGKAWLRVLGESVDMTGALCGTELCAGKRAWLPHGAFHPSPPRFPSCVLISLVRRFLPLVFSQLCTPKRS